MKTGASEIQPIFHKPYFSFFKNEDGEMFWTRIRIQKKRPNHSRKSSA